MTTVVLENSQVIFTASTSGTFYISAGAYAGNTGTYKLSVSSQGSTAPRDDFGVTAATAGPCPVGGSTAGSIETAQDRDWFGVNLVAGHTYRIDELGSPTSNGTLSDTFLVGLYNSAGVLIPNTSDDDNGVGTNSQIGFTPTASGTYYISAGAFSNNTGTYAVAVTDTTTAPTGGNLASTWITAAIQPIRCIVTNAAARWAQIITADVPDVASSPFGFVDDLAIAASVVPIDGAGGILGQASADGYRSGTNLPYHGFTQFDSADLANMVATESARLSLMRWVTFSACPATFGHSTDCARASTTRALMHWRSIGCWQGQAPPPCR